MRILMLGWEFPPFIAGGLGVACYGLTKALDQPAGAAPADAHIANPMRATAGFIGGGGGPGVGYGMDLVGDSERYARLVVALTRRESFDVIHAHDWLTYPAGIALSKVSGK